MLFNEPKLLKCLRIRRRTIRTTAVSVLFNEPKLLKCPPSARRPRTGAGFSALQRAEIAEIVGGVLWRFNRFRFSALQRAEIAEIVEAFANLIVDI